MEKQIHNTLQPFIKDLGNRGFRLQQTICDDSFVLLGLWDDELFRIQVFSPDRVQISAMNIRSLHVIGRSLDTCLAESSGKEERLLRTIKTSTMALQTRLERGNGITKGDIAVGVGEAVSATNMDVPTIVIDGGDVLFEFLDADLFDASEWSSVDAYGDALDVVGGDASISDIDGDALDGVGDAFDGAGDVLESAGDMLEGVADATSSCSMPDVDCCDIDACS